MPYVDDDQSASTAQFQAFAKGELKGPGLDQGDDLPTAWEMGAPKSQVWKLVGIVVAVAVVIAVIAALMAS
ncbi:MAG: hypothetical protein FWE35_01505 [Streptosporangiales bacterium]|nr:hypothetical protein [Streptosporangiales bacterium]